MCFVYLQNIVTCQGGGVSRENHLDRHEQHLRNFKLAHLRDQVKGLATMPYEVFTGDPTSPWHTTLYLE